jgi:hypothetical protein
VNFIPSIGSNVEFVSLIGLEEVVSCIANQNAIKVDAPDTTTTSSTLTVTGEQRKPFQCAHCQTDFTPVWRRSQTLVDEILCEKCAISAQKKMLKQEHTARLKAAFMHALQQEREIEANGGLATSVSRSSQPVTVTDTKGVYHGGGMGQHSRSVPSFHAVTDPRMLAMPAAAYNLIAAARQQPFGTFSHRSDHQLVKRMD